MHVETFKTSQTGEMAGRNPHVFEFTHTRSATPDVIFYVGEDPTWGRRKEDMVTSTESGIGLEQGMCWENAIRQALMPVTPQPSSEPDQSKYNDLTQPRAATGPSVRCTICNVW